MINFPSTSPVGSGAIAPGKPANRRIVPTGAAEKREAAMVDRRRMKDRRSRRGGKQIMDRRLSAERRRSSIDLSV